MYFVYSIILSVGFALMLPMFLLRREKYASGFRERLGNYSAFKHDTRDVIWLHCVSVGETNAARPLVDQLLQKFSDHRLVISTTTRTGQELARKIFTDKTDAIFYFPFDFKFCVRRALANYKPSLVLLMETEIWPRFIHETKLSGAKVAIVNGRLSQKSFDRYTRVSSFVRTLLADIDLALMQNDKDADRIFELGLIREKIFVTGNLKFEQSTYDDDERLRDEFRRRFAISTDKPLIIAASTHDPEERYVLDALDGELRNRCRLMIVPRHPERFDAVERLLLERGLSFVRRSSDESASDKVADVILLDSIGELRAAYPLAEIVFVGGSLIPHGGQSILEPAAAGKAIVTGPYTANFEAVLDEFHRKFAIRQTAMSPADQLGRQMLRDEFRALLDDPVYRDELGRNALAVMKTTGGATRKTVDLIHQFCLSKKTEN